MAGERRDQSRIGMAHVGGWFDESIRRDVKMLAAAENVTVQSLWDEAVEWLLFERASPYRLSRRGARKREAD